MKNEFLASASHGSQGTTHRAPSENPFMRYPLTLPVKNVLFIVSLASLLHIGYTSVDIELSRSRELFL